MKPRGLEVDGPHLRRLRHRRGLTLVQLGDRAGVSWMTVGRMERGDCGCNATTLRLVAEGLGVDPASLMPRDVDGTFRARVTELLAEYDVPARGSEDGLLVAYLRACMGAFDSHRRDRDQGAEAAS